MNSYGLIDLHCDTLAEYWKYAHTGNPDTLDDPGRVLSLSNMPKDVHWAQFYAVFIPDEERGQAAIDCLKEPRKFLPPDGEVRRPRRPLPQRRRYGEGLGGGQDRRVPDH